MVTGANAGIGKETALELARRGATVVMVARNKEKGEAARAEIIEATQNESVDLLIADMSSQESIVTMVAEFHTRYDRLHVLVNNAGVFLSERLETAGGLEMTFATNHLGYYIPTMLLWNDLLAGAPARVINVSSDAHRGAALNFDDLQHRKKYQGFGTYGQSKLANVLFTYELHRRRGDAAVTINALHPGFIASNFGRNNRGVIGLVMKTVVPWVAGSPVQGAATSIYLATSDEVAEVSGKYFVKCAPVSSSKESYNRESAIKLWEISEQLTGLTLPTALARSSG